MGVDESDGWEGWMRVMMDGRDGWEGWMGVMDGSE